jgi:membrane carboxypeptidase/penicillin-binding protein
MSTGTAHSLRSGVVIGQDPFNIDPKAKARVVKFSKDDAGELLAKTGTATNGSGDTSDVWFVVLIPGPEGKPEDGMLLVFWMGKTLKSSLGTRETGGRNLVPAAAEVMEFLRTKRGLLQAGNHFVEIVTTESTETPPGATHESAPSAVDETLIDPSDPNIDPKILETLPKPDPDDEDPEPKQP